MSEGLSSWAREMLERPRTFGTLATVSADGSPQQAVVWYAVRGDDVLVNSRVGRIWPSNLVRNGRFSFMIENGYEWVSLRGRAQVLDDPAQAREDIAAMARVYHDDEPEKMERAIGIFRTQDRISFLLHASAVTEHPDD
jgi:PPOX class probable F420-dependent enzyme